jgi:hypothetical protein
VRGPGRRHATTARDPRPGPCAGRCGGPDPPPFRGDRAHQRDGDPEGVCATRSTAPGRWSRRSARVRAPPGLASLPRPAGWVPLRPTQLCATPRRMHDQCGARTGATTSAAAARPGSRGQKRWSERGGQRKISVDGPPITRRRPVPVGTVARHGSRAPPSSPTTSRPARRAAPPAGARSPESSAACTEVDASDERSVTGDMVLAGSALCLSNCRRLVRSSSRKFHPIKVSWRT